jgi:hypothetical protein
METKEKVSPEELAAETAALQESKEDDIRANIITEYGFDEVDDIERIDKLVAKEMGHKKELSKVISQKIGWRNKANEPKEAKVIPPQDDKSPEILDKAFDEKMDKRDLDKMDLPDDLKAEIQKISKNLEIPLSKALRDPYIVFKINEYEKENKTDEAAISRKNQSGGKKVSSFENPPDVDMGTVEGRAKWDAWKEDQKKKGN